MARINVFPTASVGLTETIRRKDIKSAFLQGNPITRELYAMQFKEGVPGSDTQQPLRLEKDACGAILGTAQWRRNAMEDL